MKEIKQCMNTQKEQYKKKIDDLENQFLSEKNEFEKEIAKLKIFNGSLREELTINT